MEPKLLIHMLVQFFAFTVIFCTALPTSGSYHHEEHRHYLNQLSIASSGSSLVSELTEPASDANHTPTPLFVQTNAILLTTRLPTTSTLQSIDPCPSLPYVSTERETVLASSRDVPNKSFDSGTWARGGFATFLSPRSASTTGSSTVSLSISSAAESTLTTAQNGISIIAPSVGIRIPFVISRSVLSIPAPSTQVSSSTLVPMLRRSELKPASIATFSSGVPNPIPYPLCPAGNGTTYLSEEFKVYQIICDIDFLGNDHPFLHVNSFESCVQACDELNAKEGSEVCLAALFVPTRLFGMDDCYLKYSVQHPTVASLGIEGAILVKAPQSSASSAFGSFSSTLISSSGNIQASSEPTEPTKIPSSPGSFVESSTGRGVKYALGSSVIKPELSGSQLHGSSQNVPSTEYIGVISPPPLNISDSLLVVGPNGDLTTEYDISPSTGNLQINMSTRPYLAPLQTTPHLSRDGGRGGHLNGQHLFLFCDTGLYTTPTSSSNGDFLGFVPSSVAVDVGMNGLQGKALNLQDGIGAWSDDAGRMRSFAPLTEGEQSYNLAMQAAGQRYAVWPESSIILLDSETAIIYAPIIYDNVNRATNEAVFTYTGATLLSITANGKGGPVAERVVKKLYGQDEIEWGCVGGIRSWGPSGIGGRDGKVYIFGSVQGGLLLGRTLPENIAEHDLYEYWDGDSWSPAAPTPSSTKAFFLSGPFMNVDIFYSPRHLTFIAVYLTVYADSTFYFRYLETDSAILPPYAPGGNNSEDYVENIYKYAWSEEKILYKASPGLKGKFIYSGGFHRGYYGSNDISNGGSKMLLSWTAPTGQDPSSVASEYQLLTAEVEWA